MLRFDLHYYTCGGGHCLLGIDTRYNEDEMCGSAAGGKGLGREDFSTAPPLEKLIHTKWVAFVSTSMNVFNPLTFLQHLFVRYWNLTQCIWHVVRVMSWNIFYDMSCLIAGGKMLMYTGQAQPQSHDLCHRCYFSATLWPFTNPSCDVLFWPYKTEL